MALVAEHQRVVGQVFEQGRRRLAGPAAGEIARIVLDAGAGAGRLQHLEVEQRALFEPLRLQQPALADELVEPGFQLALDRVDRLQQRRPRRDVVAVGVDLDELEVLRLLPGQRIELGDLLDLVAEEADAPGAVLVVGGEELDRVAAHAEQAAGEVGLGALVLQRDEVGDDLALVDLVADCEREGHRGVGLDRADAVDAGDRGDDDHVVALQQRARRGVAHAVDLLVDRRFLLDIGVGARDVGLGLVIVVVGDEILDRVVGEEALELAVELRRQRLVGGEDQRRALRRLDHLGHGEGLARAGDAEQHLVALVRCDALDQLGDRLRLVALRLEIRDDAGTGGRPPTCPAAAAGAASTPAGRGCWGRRVRAGSSSEFGRGGRAGQAARVRIGDRREARLRRFAEGWRLVDQRRIEQRGEVVVERMDLRPRRLGATRAGPGLGRFGHAREYGGKARRREGGDLRRPSRRASEPAACRRPPSSAAWARARPAPPSRAE